MNGEKKIVFENNRTFVGFGFGAELSAVFEVAVNTSMVGYQEVVSNPAYFGKMVVFTYPMIGNCGLSDEDYESKSITAGAIIVREYNDFPSNFRYTKTLSEGMDECGVPGIHGVDTRQIAVMLRNEGIMRAALVERKMPREEVMGLFKSRIQACRLSEISCKKLWYSRTPNHCCNIIAVDCGITNSVVRSLNKRGCNVIIVPFDISKESIAAMHPDGIIISGGPEFPEDASVVAGLIKAFSEDYPVFGIGLGQLLIATAFGADIRKMKTGHHGSNHPVIDIETGRIEIVSQSHGYAVDEQSLAATGMSVTHRNLFDGTIEGIKSRTGNVFSVQFNPESSPDAGDGSCLFDRFVRAATVFSAGR